MMTEERLEGMVHSSKIFISGMGVGLGIGAAIGALAGVLTGILVAPKPGKETRKEFKVKAEELIGSGKKAYESQKARVLEAVEEGAKVGYEKVDEALRKKITKAEETAKKA
ncbi:MAG TPA: YtxH domain-containing protein [Actinobacteria bacterium]|nr:YtxH domain-containing protein [Actinomycetota bacterium]